MHRSEAPLSASSAPVVVPGASRSVSALTLDESVAVDTVTLQQVAANACKHVRIGTAIMPDPLFGTENADNDDNNNNDDNVHDKEEPEYGHIVANEFNAVVIEHHLKWAPLVHAEPGPLPDQTATTRLGRYDFYQTDRLVDWAVQHGLHVKGHVLVWHVTSPTALLQPLDAAALTAALRQHVQTTVGHFRGRIAEWDVVNEALAPDGTLAENLFWQVLGPDYIAQAFHWAHEADPTAKLFYNDNKVEGIGTPKADALYHLVADLKAKGVPIHGVGLQGHWKAGGVGPRQAVPTPRAVKQQIHRIGRLGLQVHISELDVRVGTLEPKLRDVAQTQIYHDLLAAALSEPACTAIYTWGFTDKHSWIHDFYTDAEDEDERPLLWDTHYRRKPAYYAVRQALSSLTPAGRVGGEGVLLETDVDVNGHVWGHAWRPDTGPQGLAEDNNAGDDRPDWLQTKNNNTVSVSATTSTRSRIDTAQTEKAGNVKPPDWLQDTTSPQRATTTSNKPPPTPDALFILREDEAEVDIVQQNHRTMSSMEVYHHNVDDDNDDEQETGGGADTTGDDDDGNDEMQSTNGATTENDDDEEDDYATGESGDEMTAPLENLRKDIPELS